LLDDERFTIRIKFVGHGDRNCRLDQCLRVATHRKYVSILTVADQANGRETKLQSP
jgi:hypothetical protein